MLIFRNKKLVFLLLIVAYSFTANAQQNHFVYLQTDNGKPFYVKMDNKILSSSSEGYIIIPDIASGVYQLKVGFPKKEYPEEIFSLSVGDENEGYLIKHFDDKGLQLFNLETLALISGGRDTSVLTVASAANDNNPFTEMLANVVKDSTILQNHAVVVERAPKSPDASDADAAAATTGSTMPDSATSESNNIVSSSTANPVEATENPGNATATIPGSDSSSVSSAGSPISKLLSRKDKEGLQMVYADENGNKTDTVRIFIPAEREQNVATSETTKNDNFDFTANNPPSNSPVDTSQLTITPTIINTNKEKDGFVLRKDTISVAADSAKIGKTAPEQVFYIGPKEKEKSEDSTEKNASGEKKGLFSGISPSKTSKKETEKPAKVAVNKIEVLPTPATSTKANSDCKSLADNADFLKLRKKMASEDNNEDMIKVAMKYFRSRCFSTAQIKDLSYLFLTDEGKYMFFDAAYAHTSDSDQYPTLESQLKDPYYQNRFEAMIKK